VLYIVNEVHIFFASLAIFARFYNRHSHVALAFQFSFSGVPDKQNCYGTAHLEKNVASGLASLNAGRQTPMLS
jgi:hypothetical protein